jgi:hypothetical protein
MATRRTRERGSFHGANIELMIAIVILGIIAAVALPFFLNRSAKAAAGCLDLLLAPTAGATCPSSGQPYAPADVDGVRTVACPAPEHLPSAPRLVRAKGGPWRLEQTLREYGGGAVELARGSAEIQESPDRLRVVERASGFMRWVVGPVGTVVLLGIALFGLVSIVIAARRKDWSGLFSGLAGLALFGWCGLSCLFSACGRREIVFERAEARVTVSERLAGATWSTKVYAGSLGVVPLPASGGRALHLLHAPDGTALRRVELPLLLPENRLDLADRLNRSLAK